MRLYLDDDSAAPLARLLRQAGHDVQLPSDVGLAGAEDVIHLTYSIRENRALLTGNYQDFLNLHNLVVQAQERKRAHSRHSYRTSNSLIPEIPRGASCQAMTFVAN